MAAEIILGLGQQDSARKVAEIGEQELRATQGIPRKVVAHAAPWHITAERPDFDADFNAFDLKVTVNGQDLDSLKAVAAEFSEECSYSEEGEAHVFHCASANGSTSERVAEAVDKLSQVVALPEVWRVHGENYRMDPISPELIFQAMLQYKASDTHLSPGQPPVFRVDSHTRPSELLGSLSPIQILGLIEAIASDDEWQEFQEMKQTSFNYHQVGLGYARVSAFMKSGAPHCTFRFLPEKIPSFEELNVPADTMVQLASLHHGLVLVTGMTGSGKSTTVAALVDWINSNKSLHILTIENPVEYVHHNKKAIISQRNTGKDVNSFFDAVTGALRHDPDVIVIGEMRDPDTIRSAISAAATGHLVISTLHANTASEVVNRVVSFFDPVERDLVKLQLRDCLRCVICQRLVPRIGGGRVPTLEMMFNDIKPINDGIAAGDTDHIRIGMQQTVSHSFIFEVNLYHLYKDKKVDRDNARLFSTEESVLDQLIMGTYSVPRLESIKHAGGGASGH
jgi:twitching motility protein PilT